MGRRRDRRLLGRRLLGRRGGGCGGLAGRLLDQARLGGGTGALCLGGGGGKGGGDPAL